MVRRKDTALGIALANAKPGRTLAANRAQQRALAKKAKKASYIAAAMETIAWQTYWPLGEESQPAQEIARAETPRLADFPARTMLYDVPPHVVLTETPEVVLERLLGSTKEQRAAAAREAEAERRLRDAVAYEAGESGLTAGSAEARGEAQQPLASPAAAALEAAVTQMESPTWAEGRVVYNAAFELACGFGTLADRWPRRNRRTERGEWQRGGMVAEVADALAYTFERRWGRAEQDMAKAQARLRDADRANKHGEIDLQAVLQAEDDLVERQEEEDFCHQLFGAAKAAYELLVGAPWHTKARNPLKRDVVLSLAGATLRGATEFKPLAPSAAQRVIVMGGGTDEVPELETALARLQAKYPALILYTGDRTRGPEAQVLRFGARAKVQVITFALLAEDGNAKPFRRIERMLAGAAPQGIIVVGPRLHGPTGALVDAAAARGGIGVWDLRTPALAAAAPRKDPLVKA